MRTAHEPLSYGNIVSRGVRLSEYQGVTDARDPFCGWYPYTWVILSLVCVGVCVRVRKKHSKICFTHHCSWSWFYSLQWGNEATPRWVISKSFKASLASQQRSWQRPWPATLDKEDQSPILMNGEIAITLFSAGHKITKIESAVSSDKKCLKISLWLSFFSRFYDFYCTVLRLENYCLTLLDNRFPSRAVSKAGVLLLGGRGGICSSFVVMAFSIQNDLNDPSL